MSVELTAAQARRVILNAQGIGRGRVESGKAGAARLIERLGYVQIDTISVIERAHHHVFWSRQPDYQPAYLDDLLAKDRRVFETWTHAVSYVPMCDYRYYLHALNEDALHPR